MHAAVPFSQHAVKSQRRALAIERKDNLIIRMQEERIKLSWELRNSLDAHACSQAVISEQERNIQHLQFALTSTEEERDGMMLEIAGLENAISELRLQNQALHCELGAIKQGLLEKCRDEQSALKTNCELEQQLDVYTRAFDVMGLPFSSAQAMVHDVSMTSQMTHTDM